MKNEIFQIESNPAMIELELGAIVSLHAEFVRILVKIWKPLSFHLEFLSHVGKFATGNKISNLKSNPTKNKSECC